MSTRLEDTRQGQAYQGQGLELMPRCLGLQNEELRS